MASKFVVFVGLVFGLHCRLNCGQLTNADWNGPLWQNKASHFFNILDVDADGLQTSNDVDLLVNGYQTLGQATAAQQNYIRTVMTNVWEEAFAAEPDSPTTLRVYTRCLTNQGQAGLVAAGNAMFPLYFNIIDINADGAIDSEELDLLFQILNADPSLAAQSFAILDTDDSGSVSLDEYVTGNVDYFSTNNPQSIYNGYLGPLI
jgi:hypothetical protein